MEHVMFCPTCGSSEFDLQAFDSLMVLRPNLALFTLTCPLCGKSISTIQPIPHVLREKVHFAAIELGAGMGREQR